MHDRLKGLRDTLAAQLLMAFPTMEKKYDLTKSVLLQLMMRSAYDINLTTKDLRSWGEQIKSLYTLQNLEARADSSVDSAIAAVQAVAKGTCRALFRLEQLHPRTS